MRARNIKPGFFKNEMLAEITPLGRILFAGLWCMADRAGRLEDRPKRIKAEVLPYDDCDVELLLNNLVALKFLLRYSADNIKYIQIVNFKKHQSPHMREPESTIPAPEQHSASTIPAPEQHTPSPSDSLIPDSSILIPDSSTLSRAHLETPETLHPDEPPKPPPQAAEREKFNGNGFEIFWVAYPRKAAKPSALKAWKSAERKHDFPGIEKILAAINRQKAWQQWAIHGGKFIPYPATWLNREGWNDHEPESAGMDQRTYTNMRNAWEFANE